MSIKTLLLSALLCVGAVDTCTAMQTPEKLALEVTEVMRPNLPANCRGFIRGHVETAFKATGSKETLIDLFPRSEINQARYLFIQHTKGGTARKKRDERARVIVNAFLYQQEAMGKAHIDVFLQILEYLAAAGKTESLTLDQQRSLNIRYATAMAAEKAADDAKLSDGEHFDDDDSDAEEEEEAVDNALQQLNLNDEDSDSGNDADDEEEDGSGSDIGSDEETEVQPPQPERRRARRGFCGCCHY